MMRKLVGMAVLLLACGSGFAFAHDAKGIAVTSEGSSVSREIELALQRVPSTDEATRSVLSNLKLWPSAHAISICFLGGSRDLRRHVLDAMSRAWPISDLTDGLLRFDSTGLKDAADCDPDHLADIRIAFTPNDGYWSYVGLESRQHSPSMNLEFDDTTPIDPEFDRLVAHETGHALGLEHEHQSPAAPDCKWDFGYIYKAYVWKSEQDMHFNFDKLQDLIVKDRHAYVFSLPDFKSVMFYQFEEKGFLDGKSDACFIKQNDKPSDQDLKSIRLAYGPSGASALDPAHSASRSVADRMSADHKSIGALIELKKTVK